MSLDHSVMQRRVALFSFEMPLWVALLVGIALLFNTISWFALGMLPDEAYYWVWSQRIEWSYFDHPPFIGWMMAPGAWLFDDALWAVRLPAVLSWFIGAVLAYRMSQQIFGGMAGAMALLVWASLPIAQAGFHIVTPDSPLVIFTWFGLWTAWRAGQEPGAKWWLLTGLFIGLALLAKYPGVVLMGALFFTLISTRSGRQALRTPWPWLGALLSFLVFLPVVGWNAANEWISFRFQFGHGVKESVAPNTLDMFLMFLGGQLGVAMPWSFFLMAWAPFSKVGKTLDGYTRALLAWNFFLPLLVFGAAGLTAPSGPNWPETAYAAGTVLLAGWLNHWLYPHGAGRPRLMIVVAILFLLPHLLLNFMRFPATIMGFIGGEVPKQRTQLSQAYGWDEIAPTLNSLLAKHPEGESCYILVDNHARAGMIAWLMDRPMRVTATQSARISQYTLWQKQRIDYPGKDCFYVKQYDSQNKVKRDGIAPQVEIPEGLFQLETVIEANNPDASLRWLAIYRAIEE